MKIHFLKTSFVLIALFLLPHFASAADVCLSTTGIKTTGKSVAGDWSNANCYGNLREAMRAASGGDTITINDGTYTGVNNNIDSGNYPPGGSAGAFTVVRARNIPGQNGVPENQPLLVKFNAGGGLYAANTSANFKYVKFWGLAFLEDTYTYTGDDHLYFKQCAFMGVNDGNNHTVSIGGGYNLLEDSVFYGKGRYKLVYYDNDGGSGGHNVCRRCVGRNDYNVTGSSGDPEATFSDYYSPYGVFLNTIDIDSDTPSKWNSYGDEIDGAFYQPKQSLVNMLVQGSMVINNAGGVGATGFSGNTFIDVAGVKVGGGLWTKDGAMVNRMTLVNENYGNFSGYNAGNFLPRNYGVHSDGTNVALTNSIFKTITGTTLDGVTGDYVNYNSIGMLGNTPSHPIVIDPAANGLLYPVRIEAGSLLATAGSGGGQVGAKIINKLGVDGTFYGETNWNTEQGSLWPWPLENWVKAQLASMPTMIGGSAMPSPVRGFAAPGNDAWGQPITLTRYIWQSLGNKIPDNIYGTSNDLIAPAAPTGLSVQ